VASVVVAGGTGHLGHELRTRLVARGDAVVVLTRGPSARHDGWRAVTWDAQTTGDWVEAVDGADAIVHLNGRSVDTRATRANIADLIASRVDPVRAMGRALDLCDAPPPVWVQAGSLAIHGDTGDAVIDDETAPGADGPPEMVDVCRAWESAFVESSSACDRRVLLRIGIGLGGEDDRATQRLARIVGLGLGGRVGSGRQWVSWIDLDDLMAVMLRAIDDPAMSGRYNATSPFPVQNAELMRAFRQAMGRRFGVPTPAFAVRAGAPILGTSASLALTGRRCVPSRLLDAGFTFSHTDIVDTVRRALTR
jgi:uncharacterized protein (TIGR01777 family)